MHWPKLSDSNTTYFFPSMKGRKAHNQITMLTKEDGTIVIDLADIIRVFVVF